ncbi:hypothetical protein K0M31_003111 [Melipona bicolor]|uniref:Uncharacterized protein n=1 Tax=Melipona bicolor TaxID=60889 RepID=A0AA40KQ65_9HYME|nr:hypothetical protein K0M31_003111 [Melipona bicolor]
MDAAICRDNENGAGYLYSIFLVKQEEEEEEEEEEEVRTGPNDVSRGNPSSSRSQSEFEAEIGLIPARFHGGAKFRRANQRSRQLAR